MDGVQIAGDLTLEANQRALSATRNRVGGNLHAVGNASGVVVRNNSITGTLQCQDNLLAPLGGVNQAASLEAQCAMLNMASFLPLIASQP